MGAHWPSTGHSSTRLPIVEAWYPGELGGRHGDCRHTRRSQQSRRTPSGNFLQSVDQVPPLTNTECPAEPTASSMACRSSHFGYGLSYTTFAYGNVQSPHRTLRAAEALS